MTAAIGHFCDFIAFLFLTFGLRKIKMSHTIWLNTCFFQIGRQKKELFCDMLSRPPWRIWDMNASITLILILSSLLYLFITLLHLVVTFWAVLVSTHRREIIMRFCFTWSLFQIQTLIRLSLFWSPLLPHLVFFLAIVWKIIF